MNGVYKETVDRPCEGGHCGVALEENGIVHRASGWRSTPGASVAPSTIAPHTAVKRLLKDDEADAPTSRALDSTSSCPSRARNC